MSDLVLLIWLIVGLVALELLRPFFKSIQDVAGFLLFPLLALLLIFASSFVYGFRPEIIPLGIVIFFIAVFRIPMLISLMQGLRIDEDRNPSLIRVGIGILFLGLAGFIAICFSPQEGLYTRPVSDASAYETLVLKGQSGSPEYFVRKYVSKEHEPKGTILLIPPVNGSVEVVDTICVALKSRGFSVLTFSQPGIDIPAYDVLNKAIFPSIRNTGSYVLSFIAGLQVKAAHQYGIYFEKSRMEALDILLKNIEVAEKLYVVGYGAGGAAALKFAAEHAETNIAGIVNVEGPLYSVLEFPDSGGKTSGLSMLLETLLPHPAVHIGTIPAVQKPLLILASDKIKRTDQRDSRYATLVRTVHMAQAPAVIAALTGAGPFDYSDVPMQYPVYSALMGGDGNRVRNSGYYIDATVALISNFICSIEKRQSMGNTESSCSSIPVSGDVYIEYNDFNKSYNPREVVGK